MAGFVWNACSGIEALPEADIALSRVSLIIMKTRVDLKNVATYYSEVV